jgi:uncharacterized protein (TIGR03000 family)
MRSRYRRILAWAAGGVAVALGIVLTDLEAQTKKPEAKPPSPFPLPFGGEGKSEGVPKLEQPGKAAPAEPAKNLGTITLQVPAIASVWFGGQKMTQSGSERSFQSPPLEPGKTYVYTVRVSWPTASGRDFTVEQEVTVRANQTSRVDFTSLAGQTGTQAAPAPLPVQPMPYNPAARPPFTPGYQGSGYRYR